MSSSPMGVGATPKSASGRNPAGLCPGAMLGFGGAAAVRSADAFTLPRRRLAPVAPVTRRPGPALLVASTWAGDSELFWTLTVHVEVPPRRAIVAGAQVWSRWMSPSLRLKATVRCWSRLPPALMLSRSISPKYWPGATAGAEIVIVSFWVRLGATRNTDGLTVIFAPAGAVVRTR